MPGLVSKAFTVLPELREARNVYVWDGMEAARAFFTPDTCAHIAALYGAPPAIEYAELAAWVDASDASRKAPGPDVACGP
ncbi:MAG: hypothetical protein JSR36_16245 [Proteobacteria bacterium]|nr:hypothetical protein [Pseudomonadota bacterium]